MPPAQTSVHHTSSSRAAGLATVDSQLGVQVHELSERLVDLSRRLLHLVHSTGIDVRHLRLTIESPPTILPPVACAVANPSAIAVVSHTARESVAGVMLTAGSAGRDLVTSNDCKYRTFLIICGFFSNRDRIDDLLLRAEVKRQSSLHCAHLEYVKKRVVHGSEG